MIRLIKTLLFTALMLLTLGAQAVVTCTATVVDAAPIFVAATANTSSGTINLSCTRTAAEASTTYKIKLSANAPVLTLQGGTATLTANKICSASPCTTVWATAGLIGTLTFTANTSSTAIPYYLLIPASNANPSAGLYSFTVPVTVTTYYPRTSTTIFASATLNPVVTVDSLCTISTPPPALNLSYTSFSITAVTGTSTFKIKCTKGTPYTIALDATSGTASGLNYTLALSAASATGTGSAISNTVTGTIAANQVGTCALGICTTSTSRTLTITY